MRHSILAFAAAAALATPAGAQDGDDILKASSRSELVRVLDGNFKGVDKNGDGSLSAAEMQAAADLIAARRVEARFKALDTNKDSMVSLSEFKALTASARAGSGTAQALKRLDANADGSVSADEFRSPLVTQFDRLDSNRDGQLSAAERAAVAPKPQGR